MRFRGQLLIPTEGGPGLSVDLEVENQQLAVVTDSETLGVWPLASVNVRRLAGDRFAMRVAGEDLHFVADDTISFAYDGIEAIERPGTGAKAGRAMMRGLRGILGLDDAERPPARIGSLTSTGSEPSHDVAELVPDDLEDPLDGDLLQGDGHDQEDFASQWPMAPEAASPPVTQSDEIVASPEPPSPAAVPTASTTDTCKALRADGMPCESPIVGASGYCYPHDPSNPVGKSVQDAHEARRNLRDERAQRLGRVYSRLDKALRKVERGEMDTEQAMAMAQLARTMCAILELDEDEGSASSQILS